jgi:hypothetical protein
MESNIYTKTGCLRKSTHPDFAFPAEVAALTPSPSVLVWHVQKDRGDGVAGILMCLRAINMVFLLRAEDEAAIMSGGNVLTFSGVLLDGRMESQAQPCS